MINVEEADGIDSVTSPPYSYCFQTSPTFSSSISSSRASSRHISQCVFSTFLFSSSLLSVVEHRPSQHLLFFSPTEREVVSSFPKVEHLPHLCGISSYQFPQVMISPSSPHGCFVPLHLLPIPPQPFNHFQLLRLSLPSHLNSFSLPPTPTSPSFKTCTF